MELTEKQAELFPHKDDDMEDGLQYHADNTLNIEVSYNNALATRYIHHIANQLADAAKKHNIVLHVTM